MKKSLSSIIFIFVLLIFSVKSHAKKEVRDFFKGISEIKNPFDLRDPFRTPFVKKKFSFLKKKKLSRKMSIEETLKQAPVTTISVVGILVGKDRRAVLKIKGEEGTFIAREGMIIGKDRAELKAILPGGIVLVEKIKNVYDDDEYIETIIPISQ